MLKECLKYGVTPFIIIDALKYFYYHVLNEYSEVNGYLIDIFLIAQDRFEGYLKYFLI
ncbi:hypothetical protein ACERC8_06860 [Streptococcus sp. E29BA]|uniref:hypothetical protein n=1 Tax=Streptococcus sp. E29BA TaxID=3278716 RepID=UPI00359E2CDA